MPLGVLVAKVDLDSILSMARSVKALRKAYLLLARTLHPDKHDQNSTDAFQDLQSAYERSWRRLKPVACLSRCSKPRRHEKEMAFFFARKVPSLLRRGEAEDHACNGRYSFRKHVGSIRAPDRVMLMDSTHLVAERLEVECWDVATKRSVFCPATARPFTTNDVQALQPELRRFERRASQLSSTAAPPTHVIVLDAYQDALVDDSVRSDHQRSHLFVARFEIGCRKLLDGDGSWRAWRGIAPSQAS